MLFFQHASLWAFRRQMKQRRGRCNLETLFGGHEGPSDTQMREIVDGVPPEVLRQVLPELFEKVRRAGGGTEFKSAVPSGWHQGDYYTAMLDGRAYFPSTTVQCASCLQRRDPGGEVHCRHTVVSATPVTAGSPRVLPLDVAEVCNSDGQDQQACEINAAKRLIPRLRQEHPQLPWIIGGDDLYCHEPLTVADAAHGDGHDLGDRMGRLPADLLGRSGSQSIGTGVSAGTSVERLVVNPSVAKMAP